jgi:deoxyadenosine/deoxycytidine kinase
MTPKQLDALFEQVQRLLTERDRARDHAVRLQDEIETLKSRLSSRARKNASKRNGLKGGRPKKKTNDNTKTL